MTNQYRVQTPSETSTVERHRDGRTSMIVIGIVAVVAIIAAAVYFTNRDQTTAVNPSSAQQAAASAQMSRDQATTADIQARTANAAANASANQAQNNANQAANNASQSDNNAAQSAAAPTSGSSNSSAPPQ